MHAWSITDVIVEKLLVVRGVVQTVGNASSPRWSPFCPTVALRENLRTVPARLQTLIWTHFTRPTIVHVYPSWKRFVPFSANQASDISEVGGVRNSIKITTHNSLQIKKTSCSAYVRSSLTRNTPAPRVILLSLLCAIPWTPLQLFISTKNRLTTIQISVIVLGALE